MDDKKGGWVPPDGGYGWVIVLATTLMNICLLPLVQCFGIIYQKEFETMGISAAETSFLLHLHSAIYCSLGLLGSPLLKKYDFRRVAFFGTLLMSVGIFLSSFAQSYGVLIFTVSVLVGVGQGIFLPASYLATNTYFKKRLTLAVSFSVTGASISSIFMPQVCNKLLEHLGRTHTVLVLAAMSVVAVVCCFLLRPIKKETEKERIGLEGSALEQPLTKPEVETNGKLEEKEELAAGIYQETTVPVNRTGFMIRVYDLFNLELLKQRAFVVVIIGMAVSFASELNIILMIPFVLPELASFKRHEVATVMSVQSIADITGRLAVPLGGHFFNVSPKVMYGSSLVASTIGRTVMAVFYDSRSTIFFCAVILGLAKGTKAVYQSVIIPKYVSLEKLPAANGLNMLLTGALSLLIGPVIGLVHDKTNSYVYALHAGSLLSMSCVALWIFYYFVCEKNTLERKEEQNGHVINGR